MPSDTPDSTARRWNGTGVDGTVSESSSDCDPFEPNKTEIRRSYVAQHERNYGGQYLVQLRLKKQRRIVATASAQLGIGLVL
jgi:hypothetical protein